MSPAPLTLYTLSTGQRIPDLHREDVREVAGLVALYAGLDLDVACSGRFEDAVAHGLAQWRACVERRAIQERAADRRREIVRGLVDVVARGAGR